MDQKHIVASGIVLVLIVAGMFGYAYLKRAEIERGPEPQAPENTNVPYGDITRVDAKHFFIDGTHTVAGEILMPTPCDLLNWDVRVAESMPEQVTIDFTVVNHAESCAQTVTPQRFLATFAASKDAVIKATFMGRPVELNLIPAAEGETPQDFEVFIKG